jgi:hypothetical protein
MDSISNKEPTPPMDSLSNKEPTPPMDTLSNKKPRARKPDKRHRVRKNARHTLAAAAGEHVQHLVKLQTQSRAILDDYYAEMQKQLQTKQAENDVLRHKVRRAEWLRRVAIIALKQRVEALTKQLAT